VACYHNRSRSLRAQVLAPTDVSPSTRDVERYFDDSDCETDPRRRPAVLISISLSARGAGEHRHTRELSRFNGPVPFGGATVQLVSDNSRGRARPPRASLRPRVKTSVAFFRASPAR